MAPKFKPEHITLVVGLGNPGERYARTYHNAGRIAMRALEEDRTPFAPRTRFIVTDTYMNESGLAVKRALRAKPSALLVVHDDADLPIGSYRLVFARGAAGHHGVESIIRALGTKEFWRLRIGIRPPAMKNAKADSFVLRPMSKTAFKEVLASVEAFRATLPRIPE